MITGSRHARHPGRFHGADRFDLVAHHADGVGARTDEDETGLLHALGEIRVLGKKPVTGMYGLGVGDLGRGNDRRHVEITLRRRRRTDANRLIGHADMLEVAINRGMHGHGLDAEHMAGTQDAQGDFAAIGDDDFV